MRIPWTLPALFALAIGLGLVSGVARAGNDGPAVMPPGPTTPAVAVPDQSVPIAPAAEDPAHHRPLRSVVHGQCGCDASPDTLGCGNLHTDLAFIFGSCRSFWGEPCLPKPAPVEQHRHRIFGFLDRH